MVDEMLKPTVATTTTTAQIGIKMVLLQVLPLQMLALRTAHSRLISTIITHTITVVDIVTAEVIIIITTTITTIITIIMAVAIRTGPEQIATQMVMPARRT